MFRLYCFLIGYIFGCFQTAYVLGKIFKKPDIRKYGSGNLGATNANRVLGFKFGFAVFVLDILKAVFGYLLAKYFFKSDLAGIWSGLGVIAGHDFPAFLNFKGGKGIACLIGLILIFDWRLAFVCYFVSIISILISHKISVGSLLLVMSVPIVFFKKSNFEILILFIGIVILSFWQHRKNILRIIKKEEPNFF